MKPGSLADYCKEIAMPDRPEPALPGEPAKVRGAVSSLHELASLETQTLAAEINILGLLRERISPAAKFGDKIQIRYHRLHYKTEREVEQSGYLTEGFPATDRGKFLSALLVLDNYVTIEMEAASESVVAVGQYAGDRLYLTKDKKWIVSERVGAYSEEIASSSQWDAHCRALSDHTLHERYSVEIVAEALFAATNKLWEKLSPKMDTLKKRHDKVGEISGILANLKIPLLDMPATPEEPKPPEPMAPGRTITKR
jgi:hypothetical protein